MHLARLGAASAVACLLFLCANASAQTIPKNPQIDIAYVAPKSEQYQAIYQTLKDLEVFETLQQFLSPLRLPRKILVKTQECGAVRVPYQGNAEAVICYEYVAATQKTSPVSDPVPVNRRKITREGVIVGAFVNQVLSEVAHAIFDVLRVPVWGDADDAADNVAALIMSQFGEEVAWRTLIGTSWMLAQQTYRGRGALTEMLEPTAAPRYYNYICIASAAKPSFGFLKSDIPSSRSERCDLEYRQLVRSFKQTILPHVDEELLKKIRAVNWMARLKMTKD